MQYSELEMKLIRLGLDRAAENGEIEQSEERLFRLLRKRGVTAEQMASTSTGGAYYEPLYQSERYTSMALRSQLARVEADKVALRAEVSRLQQELNNRTTAAARPRPARSAVSLLTEKEMALFIRVARYWAMSSGQDASTNSVWNICKTNSDNGVMQGLLKKGLVEKRYNGGCGLTQEGVTFYNTFCKNMA